MTTNPSLGQPSLFDRAVTAREQGRLEEAARLYAQVPPDDGNYAMALHHLGVLKYQAGDLGGALQLMQQSLRLNPQNSRAESNQANILFALGQQDEALAACDRALAIDPQNAPAWNIKGCLLASAEQHEAAIECWSRAVEAEPEMTEAWINRGLALRTLGQNDRAIESLERAAQLDPQNANVWFNYGLSLRSKGRNTEALACFEKAVALNPQDAFAWGNRGETENRLGQYDLALASLERASQLDPQNADAWACRGAIEHNLGQNALALASLKHALQINPQNANAWAFRGTVEYKLGQYDFAINSLEQALRLDPQNANAWAYHGYALHDRGSVECALPSLDKAVALGSSENDAIVLTRFCAQRIAQWSDLDQRWQRELELIRNTGVVLNPFAALALPYASTCEFANGVRQLVTSEFGHITPKPFLRRTPSKRLRIAYLSADFRDHAMAYLMAGVFEQHDRQRFDVSAVTFQPIPDSPMGQRLARAFGQVIDIHDKTDEQAVALMREQNIDIAIDLTGHTARFRYGIFARRPAPIQVNYLGYPGTSGAPFIDYIIGDRWVTPLDQADTFSEKIVLMPDSFQANDDRRPIAADTPSRATLGLPESGFVFCCLNNTYKITPMVFDIWMRLLAQAPSSVLWLVADNETVARNLRAEAQARGVNAERLVFAKRVPYAQYLAQYRQADLFLDTLPFNAGTTASDALWAGLPVLAQLGQTFAGRMAASLLDAVGLPELITRSSQEYEQLALKLATEPGLLKGYRDRLAARIATAPLFDTKRFTRHLEVAYQMMWQRHEQGLPPDHIIVPALTAGTRAVS